MQNFFRFRPGCFEQTTPQQINQAKESQTNEYQTVNRFENFGGGWGYSGHSVEAIRFMTDTDVMICKSNSVYKNGTLLKFFFIIIF